MIRNPEAQDLKVIQEIHDKFYKQEFPLSDLVSGGNWLGRYIICNNDNELVVAGGVRSIAEVVAITDKTKSIKDRRKALLELLLVCEFISKEKYNQLHASIQDSVWEEHLLKYGFNPCAGKMLFLNIK
jgi:hypothetical protein